MRNINNILRKNRRILAALNPKGKAKVSKQQLLETGFKFNYFTNEYVTSAGKIYKFCYEYGYLLVDEDTYFLVMRQEYVE